ncbi:MAG TPA: ankyrin repeat domain-containing protein [Rickettsia endosymbiont of Pyrocoelia pectoralis]|nr:ankyrin repeat domain-containing protein [Rickettsia endosymbiont of Pyrocoelia pectoralis]
MSIPDKHGRTPLHWIVSRGWKNETQTLLKKLNTETINKISRLDGSVLHVAAYFGYTEIAEILLYLSPNLINTRDENGETPLHHAAKNEKSYKIIEYILQKNSNLIEATDYKHGRTALHIAAECGCKKTVEILLKLNPNLANKVDNGGWTPLHFSAKYGGDAKIIKLLLNAMTQNPPDYLDVTALSLAISNSAFYTSSNEHERVIEILLNNTSSQFYIIVNLHRSITSDNERVIAMVLNKIIKENITLSQECINIALDIANNTRYSDIYRNQNIVKLIEDKLGLKAKTIITKTDSNKENIAELSNKVTNENSKFKQLISAIKMDNTVNAVKLITHMNAKELIEKDEDGGTALHWAAAKNNEQVVTALFKKNPNLIDIENKYGLTALNIADMYEFPKIVELLKNFSPNSSCEYELLGSVEFS